MKYRIYWPGAFIVLVYPLLLILSAIVYYSKYGISWFEVGMLVCTYYVINITIGIGMHRLWAHNAYKVNKVVEFILAILAAASLQGPSLVWASDHYKHHTYTDEENDPHSPSKYENNKLAGFLWSHILWTMYKSNASKNISHVTLKKLGRNKLLLWQYKYYWQLAVFTNIVVPSLLGYMICGTATKALGAFIFAGIGRAIQQQMTFCVNSVCHIIGSKKYVNSTACDIWWLAVFLLGENWHNFHHAFPSDYRNGHKWYHLDIHKWIIYLLSKANLAWDLNTTSNVRIDAKVVKTSNYYSFEALKKEYQIIVSKIEMLQKCLHEKLSEFESSSSNIKSMFLGQLKNLQSCLERIRDEISTFMSNHQLINQNLLQEFKQEVTRIEYALKSFKLNAHENINKTI